jgi:DNA-binding LytR/AlgR family response regulator
MLIGDGIAPYHNFIEFFGITVAVGIFPVMIMVFFVERNLSSKNIQKAEEYSQLLFKREAKKEKNTEITITPETTTTSNLVINYKDFVFATSDNNYSTIYFKEEEKLDNQLLRLTFKNLEEQLIEFSNIIRCHKSYMVNKNYISEVKGNARSLMLKVELYDKMIPVSRSFPKENLL